MRGGQRQRIAMRTLAAGHGRGPRTATRPVRGRRHFASAAPSAPPLPRPLPPSPPSQACFAWAA
eukprot:7247363-Lingulodinium_polyedra.AAC.1